MTRPLFEQYKDALRRGHVALLGGELEAALAAYREAARLVPDRPLPHASIGTVLGQLGRFDEALVAFDAALALGPGDEPTLTARAAVLADRDAATVVAAAAAPGSRSDVVPPTPAPTVEPAIEPAVPPDLDGHAGLDPVLDAITVAPPESAAPESAAPEGGAASEAAAPAPEPNVVVPGSSWPAIDLPSPPPPPLVGPPPDPAILQADAERLIDAGDVAAARDVLLTAVAVHRAAGRPDAALDACLQLLTIVPGDPRVHLEIANLQLDRGWRGVATEKIELLLRLTSLSGDAQAEADVHLLAADRLRDESPVRLDARKRGVAAT